MTLTSVAIIAIIVTFNRLAALQQSLSRCRQLGFDAVIVVDNASTDGTAEFLASLLQEWSGLHVCSLGQNLGGAGGFGCGLQQVYSWHQAGSVPANSWCVLFDDDAYPEPDCVQLFRSRAATLHYTSRMAVAAAVFNAAGEVAEVNRPIINVFRRPYRLATSLFNPAHASTVSVRDFYHVSNRFLLSRTGSCEVDAISFVGLFLNLDRLAQREYPLPNANLFIYGDDTLYTWNLSRCRSDLLLDTGLGFVHNTRTGYEVGLVRPIWKLFYLTRNSWLVYRALVGSIGGPLFFLIGLISKLRITLRYPSLHEKRQARLALRLALVDILQKRRSRPLKSVQASLGIEA